MKENDQKLFHVCMLGDFSVVYEGKKIILGRKSTAKFVQLLQFVWLQGEKGATKEQLIKALYDRNDVSDSNNSVNNLLYQLRRQMMRAGLPKGEYISRINGIYVTDDQFPVKLDAHEFEQWIHKAEQTEDEREKCDCYQKAFELYRGGLLPAVCTEIWVIEENLRLKRMYEVCVRWLGEYYKQQEDYTLMSEVYDRAAKLYPWDDWQICRIDGLAAMGNYKTAVQLYEEMVHRYSEEMGLPPSRKMMECQERMSQIKRHVPGEIENVKKGISETLTGCKTGREAYYCSYQSFVDICRIMKRNMERSAGSAVLVLCTLVDYEGKMIQNQDKLKARSAALKEVIGSCIRKGDIFTQYNVSQYLILLVGSSDRDSERVSRRIRKRLKEQSGRRAELECAVASLEEL